MAPRVELELNRLWSVGIGTSPSVFNYLGNVCCRFVVLLEMLQ
jgi:hypothetical protein